ncbi:MAG: WxcM-like domain-containing protein [Muribaculaceae bacterium]|nr:WxcM-like domain-containing protein [Muribaculaceae bacterium]
MDGIKVIEGEIFRDHRGQISSLNTFYFDGVKRCYMIHHPDVSVIRGWHAHKDERKWFYCVKGRFSVALVKVIDWNNPDPNLSADVFHLTENDSKLVCVPKGYANCLKAYDKDSIMLVLSDKTLDEAVGDSWRYDKDLWVDWENIENNI